MIANNALVNNFVDCNLNGISHVEKYNGSMHFVNSTLYSYNTAIGQYNKKDGTFVVNMTKYSQTTTKQRNLLIKALKERKIRYTEVDKVKRDTTNLIKN